MERHDVLAHIVFCERRWDRFKPTDAVIDEFAQALRYVEPYWAEKAFQRVMSDEMPPTGAKVARVARLMADEVGEGDSKVPLCIACDGTGFRYVDDRHVTPCGCPTGARMAEGSAFNGGGL